MLAGLDAGPASGQCKPSERGIGGEAGRPRAIVDGKRLDGHPRGGGCQAGVARRKAPVVLAQRTTTPRRLLQPLGDAPGRGQRPRSHGESPRFDVNAAGARRRHQACSDIGPDRRGTQPFAGISGIAARPKERRLTVRPVGDIVISPADLQGQRCRRRRPGKGVARGFDDGRSNSAPARRKGRVRAPDRIAGISGAPGNEERRRCGQPAERRAHGGNERYGPLHDNFLCVPERDRRARLSD